MRESLRAARSRSLDRSMCGRDNLFGDWMFDKHTENEFLRR